MRQGVGIHLTADRLMVAVVEETDGQLQLSHVLSLDRSLPDPEIDNQLHSFFRKHRLPHHVILGLPANQAVLGKFNVPFTQPHQIDEIIHFESEKYIHSRPIEELVVDYHILKSTPKNSRLLVAAMPRTILAESLQWIEEQGIYPVGVDLDIMALFYLVPLADSSYLEKGIVVLDVRLAVCNVLLIDRGTIFGIRSIRLENISSMEREEVNLGETAEWNAAAFLGKTASSLPTDQKTVNKIENRIVQALRTSLITHKMDTIYLCGNPDLLHNLPTLLQEKFQIPTCLFSLPSMNFAQTIERIPEAYVSIGLAWKSLQNLPIGFNFRKEGFRYTKGFDLVQKPLSIALTFLFLLILLSGAYLQRVIREQQDVYEELVRRAEKIGEMVDVTVGKPKDSFQKIYAIQSAMKQRIEAAEDDIPSIKDPMPILVELFEVISQVRKQYYFTIDLLNMEEKEIILEGFTEDVICFDLFHRHLTKVQWTDPVNPAILQESKTESSSDPRLKKRYKYLIKLRE